MARHRLKTSNPREVRYTLSKVVNMLRNSEIDPKEANSIIAACNAILGAIRVDEQQKKIDELERIIAERDIDRG